MVFIKEVYELTTLMPRDEEFGLKKQLRRAAVSTASNIAEGCSRSSPKEFIHFLEISIGSSFECETQLLTSINVGLLTQSDITPILNRLHILQRKTNALIIKLKDDL